MVVQFLHNCSKCGRPVQRTYAAGSFTCFDCKKKRSKERYATRPKPRTQEPKNPRTQETMEEWSRRTKHVDNPVQENKKHI